MSASNSALAALRRKTLHAAKVFHDYNFRNYFVQKTKDEFAAMEQKPAEEIARYVKGEGKANLSQMRRMAAINRMYGKTQVFLDTAKPRVPRHGHKGAADASTAAKEAEK